MEIYRACCKSLIKVIICSSLWLFLFIILEKAAYLPDINMVRVKLGAPNSSKIGRLSGHLGRSQSEWVLGASQLILSKASSWWKAVFAFAGESRCVCKEGKGSSCSGMPTTTRTRTGQTSAISQDLDDQPK